jgi:TRAP-type mannitol/chloroaromatic compound transport system substrate-binding protein
VKKRILSIPVILLVAMSLVVFGCPPVPVEPVVVVEPPVVIEWDLQMVDPPGDPAWVYVKEWVETVYTASGGRLQITLHAPGALVPPLEVFPAISKGVLHAAQSWGHFWIGIDPAFGMTDGLAIGMTPEENHIWYFKWGGRELVRELHARYNIRAMYFGMRPPETFLWARHPIRTFEDLEGLTVRAAGFPNLMFARLGIPVFFIPGGEIAPALLKGVVDAAEFDTLTADLTLGLHEAAAYAMIGPRAPSAADKLIINMDRWNELPPDLQAIVTSSAEAVTLRSILFYRKMESEAVARAEGYGVTLVHIDESLAELVKKAYGEMLEEFAAKDPFFARVLESQRAFLEEFRQLRALLWPWE